MREDPVGSSGLIFNEDLMTIPHEKIMSARVDYTIVGGKVVYKRDGT